MEYLPSQKTLWKRTADQEYVYSNENSQKHQTNANGKVNQQQQEKNGILRKPAEDKEKIDFNIANDTNTWTALTDVTNLDK